MSGGDGDGYRAPFTAVQWQELEHQALIYKYLVAGVPVPSDLILSIRRSLEALSARLFNYHNLGYGSYYGTKFDPEPGRCRRTDGKKWRCSKDAYHESKYCERHMHRGRNRNRSRKPVESQSSAVSQITTLNNTGCGKGSYQNVSSASSSSQSLFSVTNSASLDFGSKASKLQVADTCPYVTNNKDLRYSQGLTVNVDCQNYPSGGNVRGLGMNSNANDSWRLMSTSQVPTNFLLRPQNDSYLLSNSLKLNMPNAFEPMIDTTSISKERQQHFFSGSEVGSQDQVKHDQHSMHPFNNLPKAKEVWSNFDDRTQLSMSMDPDYNTRNDCLPNDA